MRLQPPQFQNITIERGRFAPFWMQWLQQLHTLLGFGSQTIYRDCFCGGSQAEAWVGDTSLAAVDGDLTAPQLRNGQDDGRIAEFRLPNDYKDGTDLEPFAVWAPSSAAAGNVVIELSYAASDEGTALSETAESMTTAVPETAYAPTRTDFTAISGTNLVKGSIVIFGAMRDGDAVADSYGADCVFLGVGFKYQAEGIGHEKAFP